MSLSIQSLIESRVSVNHFDPARPVTDADIRELVRLATRAPSAFNFQNWKFIAVRTPAAKAQLKAIAYDQQKVADAAVTFIICGTLEAHKTLPHALRPAVEAGIMDQTVADTWVEFATAAHPANPQLQRDEAIRSASLAAMTLMLAAEGMGLSSCSMVGFDAAQLADTFELAGNEIPVMLVTVGYAAPGNWPQKPRRPVEEVIALV
ncbi:nitroreductase [Chitinivorax tropicus]|uniref:Nitroreductase n=1 Tax=Chitinivorax tropicus TaxID=714531 RepID=A0A840MK03_9PROT|nr:nitroreductase family protein [Chitinivorax tropicus]MBB5019524.1 nitroreductase [Chitinivorax tropicus]